MNSENSYPPLFAAEQPIALGIGFHNVGSGVLRASNEDMIKKVEIHYGERCGHLPLDAERVRVLVEGHNQDIHTQMQYLSALFGKQISSVTIHELQAEISASPDDPSLVVPYVNVPETASYIQESLDVTTWGLPPAMTHLLKNKATFYQLIDELALGDFYTPDYVISNLYDVATTAQRFLATIEELYAQAGLSRYPLGVMLRASESDGNYGCCLLFEQVGKIIAIPDGDPLHTLYFHRWPEALAMAQELLAATMNPAKELRVVISRFIDFVDSPGMSVVVQQDRVYPLGWNGQLQKGDSRACVGTSTYIPKNAALRRFQQQYESLTAEFCEFLLRKTAARCDLPFASLQGLANIDILIPSAQERALQRYRQQPQALYLAECNPRWTNYTDAIMTLLGASKRAQHVGNMLTVIQKGLATVDKYPLPLDVVPADLRERIFERDAFLQQFGTRIICRMTRNPMGVIFAGDVKQAEQELESLVHSLAVH